MIMKNKNVKDHYLNKKQFNGIGYKWKKVKKKKT